MSGLRERLGPYRITGVLGRGAMGVVYAGRNDAVGNEAALKSALVADPEKLSQIRREIHALARLTHPGVVRILDQGIDAGLPWYAMELLSGATLRDVFRGYWRDYVSSAPGSSGLFGTDAQTAKTSETLVTAVNEQPAKSAGSDAIVDFDRPEIPLAAGGRLTEALSLVQRLCDALAYVHGEGIVHRDLKPSNIFVRHNGLPVLVDFGLTQEVGGTTGREVIGAVDRVAGSVAYMAPEQIRGESLDARSDIYSMGCVLYELVTGRPPYIGNMDAIVQGHLHGELAPASTLAEGVPEELDALLDLLLEKDRNLRPGYAEDLARQLESLGAMPPAWGEALPSTRPYLYRPTFVGRGQILARLDAQLARPLDGHGGMVFVSAESGAGKTRLALEVSARARRSAIRVISGECTAVATRGSGEERVHAAPLHPLRTLADSLVDRCLEGGEKVTRSLLGDRVSLLAPYYPDIAGLPGCSGLSEPTPLPADAARTRLFRALEDTLEAFTADAPTLLVLDDLQWADELTLGLLAHLGENGLGSMPLLVLGIFRSDEAPDRLRALSDNARYTHLTLERMARDEVGRMTGAMLALREPPADFVDFLDAKSEGNPFFVAEYLRLAVAEHVLERDARGCWGIADSGAGGAAAYSDLPLPQSQRQMVELRLGRVSPASQAVLHAAAVMGRVFDLEILRRVLDMEDQHLLDALDEMIRRQILEPGEDGGFRFIHDKLHEIAAARLGEAERRSLHERVALAIEARYSGDPALEPLRAALGLHWSKAGVPEKAAPELLAAADRAQAFNAVDEAIQRYRAAFGEIRAVCSGEPEDQNRWRVLAAEVCEKLGDVLALTGAHAAARDAYDEAVGQLPDGEPGGIEVHIARLHRKAGKTWEIQHAHEEALDAYALADEHLEQVTEARRDRAWRQEWIQVALNRIWVHYWRVKVAEMDAELARVGPFVAEHGLPLHRYHYFMSIVLRDYRQDRYRVSERTLEDGRRMLAAAQESGAQAETAFADFVLGFGLLFAGQLDEAEAHLSRALESCRRIGDVSGEIRACAYLVLCHRRQGRVEETRESARELLTLAGAQQMRDYLGVAQACLGWAAFRSGDQRSAREQSKQALATWKELSFPYPFQWSAALILLRAQMSRAPLGPLVDLAGLMRQPEQMHLPDAIDRGLEQAIAARASGDHDRVRAGLADAMAAAERDGFM